MRAALVLVLTLLCLPAVARADVHASKVGKVSVTIPKKWTVTPKDELVRAVSPDGEIAFVMWVVDTTDAKVALKTLEGELYSSIHGLKWVDKVKKLKIGRLPATWVEGVGVNGRGTQLDVLVVVAGPTPTKKGVIMFAAIEHEKLAAHSKTIQTLFQSLKPTK